MDGLPDARLRALPQVQKLLDHPLGQGLVAEFSRAPVVAALRGRLDEARLALRRDGSDAALPDMDTLLRAAGSALEAARHPLLARVINATGIVLHTNLGRAPLAQEAIAAAIEAAGYCNLEFDLATGERGSRTQGIEKLLRQLTGAEASLAVNNNAAAVLLALSGLAGASLTGGGEVVVSRGELVEIGGGFRIPDVIQQGGARLIEVGTTNKTRLADYERAITPSTRVLLKVHQSNFRISGFTEETPLSELAALAQARGLLLVHDLGSGTLVDLRGIGLPAETTVQESIASGVDVVAFSGDKLLGGPQSGILAGRAGAIDRLRRHPLLRALRLDKLTLAALEATLRLHLDGGRDAVPALRKMGQSEATLRARAERLAALLGPSARIVPSTGFAGGGTMPDAGIASLGVALHSDTMTPERLKALLRAGRPPVIARIADGAVLLDMLTVDDDDIAALARTAREALGG
jgi:L-seryl-tRNA(Ser) seleniumtransferase